MSLFTFPLRLFVCLFFFPKKKIEIAGQSRSRTPRFRLFCENLTLIRKCQFSRFWKIYSRLFYAVGPSNRHQIKSYETGNLIIQRRENGWGGEFTARGFSSLDRFSLTRLDAEPAEPGRIPPAHTHRTPEEEKSYRRIIIKNGFTASHNIIVPNSSVERKTM